MLLPWTVAGPSLSSMCFASENKVLSARRPSSRCQPWRWSVPVAPETRTSESHGHKLRFIRTCRNRKKTPVLGAEETGVFAAESGEGMA